LFIKEEAGKALRREARKIIQFSDTLVPCGFTLVPFITYFAALYVVSL
jgi:hypothetical protein